MIEISYKTYCLFGAARNPSFSSRYLDRYDEHVYYYHGKGPISYDVSGATAGPNLNTGE